MEVIISISMGSSSGIGSQVIVWYMKLEINRKPQNI